MQTASIQARIPKDLKEKAELLFKRIGLDISTAIRVFFIKAVELKRMPFELGLSAPVDEKDEQTFWNAIADESLKDVWGRPEDDIWDEILPKLPLIKRP